MGKTEQVNAAMALGRVGYLSGRKAPAQCAGVYVLLSGRRDFVTPEGAASTLAILDGWNDGFMYEHLRACGLAQQAAA